MVGSAFHNACVHRINADIIKDALDSKNLNIKYQWEIKPELQCNLFHCLQLFVADQTECKTTVFNYRVGVVAW